MRCEIGLSYDEASVLFSHVWGLPAIYPSTKPQSVHYYSSGARRGTRGEGPSHSIPLPLFYCDTPGEDWDHLEEDEDPEAEEEEEEAAGLREREESASEIHEEVTRQEYSTYANDFPPDDVI